MNGFYVIVSIPLLLVLAGFNHAHGLTTFGKSSPSNPGNDINAKQCKYQTNCETIKNTTCLNGYCWCGDNRAPVNGACSAPYLGPNHICNSNENCVLDAVCVNVNELNSSKFEEYYPKGTIKTFSICVCSEGYPEYGAACGAERPSTYLGGFLFLVNVFTIYKMLSV
ncbi:hypothetical protein ABEB36_010984 [Hypothenemus hampei]|uniref:Uncharacterized protein n=1 Tax=Hypothenemus hampei TaxID=57062 RepID=A0ABD1EE09_HYPHA